MHCLLGENGAGKSTLCNSSSACTGRTPAACATRGAPFDPSGPADALRQGIAMVHQHFSLVPDMSVVENLLLGQARGVLNRSECARQLEQLADDYGLALDPHARRGSVGRRAPARRDRQMPDPRPRLLVLDEPTAVLLPDEIEALLDVCRRVAAADCGVVLVTHKLAEIKKVADRVTVLRGGRVVATVGQPGSRDRRAGARHDPGRSRDPGYIGRVHSRPRAGQAPSCTQRQCQTPKAKVEALQIDGLTCRRTIRASPGSTTSR